MHLCVFLCARGWVDVLVITCKVIMLNTILKVLFVQMYVNVIFVKLFVQHSLFNLTLKNGSL